MIDENMKLLLDEEIARAKGRLAHVEAASGYLAGLLAARRLLGEGGAR